jgi:phage minor structural protein, N-terminal domain protein|nr:MAG TPA: tail protein [Siphoviridae sp. ctwl93]
MKVFLFNNDEKLIGTVSPLEGIQNEEINKIQTIECTVVYSELIEKASYIGHKDYSDNRIFHLYKIDHVTKTSTTDVKIVGVHTFFDDMESDGYVKDFRPTNRELVGVLTTILDGSRWQLGTVNIQRRYTGNFYYVTRKEAISKLIEATQIEIKPRLEFSRGKITGRYLDVFTRLGARNGKVFVHGRDLLTVSEKKSQGAIYTAVVGRGKGEETDTGGYGRRISFKDVEWRRTSGQPVDKPVGQEYVEIPAMTKLYGFEKGTKPRIKIVEFQDEADKEKLLRLSYEWLEKNSRMQVEYSAKVLNVGNLELGDTVGIFNPKLGIKYETRVFKVKRNLVDNKLTEFGIGDKVTTSPFSRTIELAKEMKNFQDDTVYWLDKIRERLSDKLINEDGYNYDLKADNEYKVPAGYYSFDKPIDQNPTKVVYMGAGKIAIADSKKPTGEWNWRTFLDGRGATLDLINTGVLRAGRIQSADGRSYWDLDTGEFHMEQSAINEAVKTVVNGKVQEIVGEVKKNLPTKEELKGKSSYLHKKYSDYADGRNMSDNSTLKYIGIYTGDKQQAPTNASEYSWTKIKVDGKLYKAYSNSLNGLDFTLVEPDENAKLFAKNRPRVNIVNDNDISDIWQANMFLSFKPNTKYTLTARAKGNSNKLWAYFRNNRTNAQYNWGQLEFRGLETKSITFTTTNDVDDVLFKFVLVPEDEDWTGIQIDWFTIYEGDKRYTDYPTNEPAQYHKYRYFGYVFKEGTPAASDFEWFDLQQTSITNDKYTHIVYSDNADGSNFGREPKKYMGVARTTSPAQPTDKTSYKWFKVKGEDGRDGVDGKSINRNYITGSDKLTNINSGGTNWEKTVENGTLVFTKVRATEGTGIWTQIMPILKDNFQNEVLTWSVDVKASKNISFNNVGQETNGFKGRVDLTTNWQRISHTFTNRYTQHYAFVFYQMIGTCSPGDKVYVRLPKLEKGNVATEWSPAYEDLRGRDGVSNYIHRKYSDYSNGANMSDNSNLKYIGIYTGTSPTPPTTASSYLWSKIKGEDGANGIPGAKGADGRTPYFHTAYANSPTGDRDFSTTNSNDKLYIGTYSDFEIADSTDYRRYKWVKIKGENGRNGNNGRDGVSSYIYRKYSDNANGSPMSDNSSLKYIGIYTGTSATAPTTPSAYTWSKIKGEDGQQGVPGARGSDGRTSYLHTAYANSATGEHDFSTTNSNGKEYIGTYTDFEINDSNDYRRYKWVKIKGENGRNGTDGHTLTANLRLEGGYLNNVTNDVKAYLDVFYDGQKITDGFNARVKFKGGIQNTWSNFWDAKVDNTGFLTNVSWGNKEQPYPIALELIALVTYKNLNTVANARLDNLPDVRLINETVKKYKTFESTLEGFTSVVGEIDTKVFSKSYFKNNLNSEDVEKTGNDLYFNTKENLQANEFYTILADLDNVPANQQAYIYSASDGGDKKTIQNGLNYWVVKYTTNQTRINLYPLGTNTKVKNVRIYKGDFRVKKDDERENLYSDYGHDDKGFLHLILNKNKINGNVYLVKFDASNFSNGARWDVYNRVGYNQENLTQVFKTKDNEFTFTINDNTTADRMYLRIAAGTSPDISNVEIYDVTLGYAKNKEVSKLESSIKQTKDEIDLKVSKDNVIAAINASVETTGNGNQGVVKINADKVDISGTLKAYTGNIGSFYIGKNTYVGYGKWITGTTHFNVGMSDGTNGDGGAAFWVNWGYDWSRAGDGAWYVTNAGNMYAKRRAYLTGGIDVGRQDIYGYATTGKVGPTSAMWWNQIDSVRSSSSDKRLKTNIKPTKIKALDTLNSIEIVEFNWKKDNKFEKIGAIAQQVQAVDENLVIKDEIDKVNNDYLRIKYYDTIPYLIKAVQELSKENDNLKLRLQKLEEKINGNI